MAQAIAPVIDMQAQLVALQNCRDWHQGLQERFESALERITHDSFVFDDPALADPTLTPKLRAAATTAHKAVAARILTCARHFEFTEAEADDRKCQQLRDDLLTSFLSYSLRTAPKNRRHSGAIPRIAMPQVKIVDHVNLQVRGAFAQAASDLNDALITAIEADLEFQEHRMSLMERSIRSDMPTVTEAAAMGGILHQSTERLATDIGDALSLNDGLSTYLSGQALRAGVH